MWYKVLTAVAAAAAGAAATRVSMGRAALVPDGGLSKVPPMGWMSWEIFRCNVDCKKEVGNCVNDELYETTTDALVSGGFREAGYAGVHIDDCWESTSGVNRRDASGRLAGNSSRFPKGMKALGDYMHAKGISYGIYSDEGYVEGCNRTEGAIEESSCCYHLSLAC